MTTTCTITKSGRCDTYGRPLLVGQRYTSSNDEIKSLWQAGFCSVTDAPNIFEAPTYPSPQQMQVASIGTPFCLPPGDNGSTGLIFTGTAGNFSLSGVILSNIWTALRGCWCYLPANFGGSSYPAGWYWTVFSSDTAGIVYTNTYTSGIPSAPETPTAFPVNLNGRLNQTSAEVTGPTGIIIPGGSMGKNGTIKTHWRIGGNIIGTRYYRTYLDAVAVGLLSGTTSPMYEALTSVCNQGDESKQILSHTNSIAGVGTGFATINANGMSSVDTYVDKALSLSLQLSSNWASAIILHADVTVTYGA